MEKTKKTSREILCSSAIECESSQANKSFASGHFLNKIYFYYISISTIFWFSILFGKLLSVCNDVQYSSHRKAENELVFRYIHLKVLTSH